MKHIGIAVFALIAPVLLARDASSAPFKAHTELRVFIVDKATDKGVADLKGFGVTAEVKPKDGELRKLPMQLVEPKAAPKSDPNSVPKVEPKKADAKQECVCGQVKELDEWWVELIVVQPLHDVKPEDLLKQPGYIHDHGGPYFTVEIPADMIRGGTLSLDIDLSVTVNGDVKKVRNFNYPTGLYDDTTGWIRKTLKEVENHIDKGQWDKAGAPLPHMCSMIQALPVLAVEKAKVDPETLRKSCFDSLCEIENAIKAQAKDRAKKAIDQCHDNCGELKGAASKSQGAKTN